MQFQLCNTLLLIIIGDIVFLETTVYQNVGLVHSAMLLVQMQTFISKQVAVGMNIDVFKEPRGFLRVILFVSISCLPADINFEL